MASVRSQPFYNEYHGHTIEHLERVHGALRGERAVIWTLGDSTLDNKHWLLHAERQAATNGYERVLTPPHVVPDVAHAINVECVARGLGATHCAINCAVEEATLGGRANELLAQDAFVREHVREQDVLVVSCGGNDIALRPTVSTIVSMGALLATPLWLIESLGSSPLLYRLVPGLGHFVSLFGATTARFVSRVVETRKPKAVVVCMLYYLDEVPGGSWADGTLRTLGYDTDPSKLQTIMRIIFELATRKVRIPGVETVVAVPLYTALDGKDTSDYEARVEPSVSGGAKLAKLLMDSMQASVPGMGSSGV